MYAKMLDYMVGRGPDNAFVLYAYAIFATGTREADFDDVMDMVHRARDCEPKTGTHIFDLASKGFFRQAMVFNPKSAQAHSNYAIVMQFVHQDYAQAEDGIRDPLWSRGLGDVYKRQHHIHDVIKISLSCTCRKNCVCV